MDYQPITAVWEITMGCNMRCKHCGSSCNEPLPDELTTEEALNLCDQIGELGLKWLTLSGGEPLTRKDWPQLAARLRDNGVVPNIITNGWLITDELLDKALDSGVGTFAVSLDGTEELHDKLRRKGAFARVMNAYSGMARKSITGGAITTVHQKNIGRLAEIREILIDHGVEIWQLQIGLPMGSFAEQQDMILQPEQMDDLIDFIYDSSDERIRVYPADCVGYYNNREVVARTRAHRASAPVTWQGCNAGKRSFGILHNGDILGCTSIRDRQFIEGNIRTTPLKDLWGSTQSFAWNRQAAKESLGGFCRKCKYGETCLAGCPNTRLTMHGNINSENAYCSYNVALKQTWSKIEAMTDFDELASLGKKFANENDLQLAQMVLERALAGGNDDIDLLNYLGYTNFMLHNYPDALEANKKALCIDADSVYANKGMGLTLAKMGELDQGLSYLEKSARLTTAEYMDPYYDMAVVLMESGRQAEAADVVKQAEAKSPGFRKKYFGNPAG